MSATVATVRKWGSSLAVILPADLVRAEHLSVGDRVALDVRPEDDVESLFGLAKRMGWPRMDAQAIKDGLRSEERKAHIRKWGRPL